jgi:hypothetical protein
MRVLATSELNQSTTMSRKASINAFSSFLRIFKILNYVHDLYFAAMHFVCHRCMVHAPYVFYLYNKNNFGVYDCLKFLLRRNLVGEYQLYYLIHEHLL